LTNGSLGVGKQRHTGKSEYEYVLAMGDKLGDYAGEWIAVVGGKIVATGNSAETVYDKAKELFPDKRPFIMRVPTDKIMIL
jgi:Family of unknown function (DUF5678)